MAKTKHRSPSVAFRTTLRRAPDSAEIALIEAPVNTKLGKYTFRTTIAAYGGKSYVEVRSRHDAPRESTKVKAAWAALSYSHRREQAEAIESAKKPETRE